MRLLLLALLQPRQNVAESIPQVLANLERLRARALVAPGVKRRNGNDQEASDLVGREQSRREIKRRLQANPILVVLVPRLGHRRLLPVAGYSDPGSSGIGVGGKGEHGSSRRDGSTGP